MTKTTLEIVHALCLTALPITVILVLGINWHASGTLKHETCYQRLGYNLALDKSYIIEDYCGGKNN